MIGRLEPKNNVDQVNPHTTRSKNMKKIGLVLTLALMIPFAAMAMDHKKDNSKMDHSKMDHGSMDKNKMDHSKMDMGGMSMGGDMIMLQNEEVDGVKGSAHMMDVKEKMAKHGMATTHHIMIDFKDGHGMSMAKGKVAVKVEAPDGKISKPIMMMGMGESFGADITLDQKGMYHFKIGTKLEDGKKRTFHMHHDNM
jgi:hypothetical protein